MGSEAILVLGTQFEMRKGKLIDIVAAGRDLWYGELIPSSRINALQASELRGTQWLSYIGSWRRQVRYAALDTAQSLSIISVWRFCFSSWHQFLAN